MAKDKKKKQVKKRNKGGSALTAVAPAKRAKPGKSAKLTRRLQAISKNPLLADIVAAALVATASALKDSKKARQLAASAGDELTALSKEGSERGNALWQLALEIGRRSLDSLAGEEASAGRTKANSRRSPKK